MRVSDDERDAEQAIAERIEILSRALRGAIYTSPELVPQILDPLDLLIAGLLTVMREQYAEAGSPYGEGDDGLWRWWGRRSNERSDDGTGDGA